MANTGYKGINVRQTSDRLLFDGFLQDSTGAIVTGGTTSLYLYELQSDGTLKSYDFNDNVFKSTALTAETQAMTQRAGNNGGTNTGLWTYALTTLTGFTKGAIYYYRVKNTGASPTDQFRKFQFGSAEGDLVVTTTGYLEVDAEEWKGGTIPAVNVTGVPKVDLVDWLGTAPDALSSGKIPADLKLWLTAAPASLSANGYVRGMLLRWLTDDAGGTPNALQSGRVDGYLGAVAAGVIAAASFAANALDAVWSTAARVLTAGTNIVLAKGVGVTGFNDLDATAVRAAVGLGSANLDTQLDALPTNTELASALAGADDAVLAAIAALNNLSAAGAQTAAAAALAAYAAAKTSDVPTAAQTRDAVLAGVVEGAVTVKQSLQLSNAAAAGKLDGAAGPTTHLRDLADTKNRITATVDATGRTAVTRDYD